MRVLITSGGTKIPIDRVRSITNMSKGTFGSQIADEFLHYERGNTIDFLMAKESKRPEYTNSRQTLNIHRYETFWEYKVKLYQLLKLKPDIIILAAAVSDYEVENVIDGKIRSSDDMIIKLKPLPKLINLVKETCPDAILCGFKLLVNSTKEELIAAAEKSIKDNNCDLVIANDLATIKDTKDHSMIIVQDGWHEEYFRNKYNLANIVKHFCIAEHIKK